MRRRSLSLGVLSVLGILLAPDAFDHGAAVNYLISGEATLGAAP